MPISRSVTQVFASESVASGAALITSDPIDLRTARSAVAMVKITNQATLTWPGIVYANVYVDESNSGTQNDAPAYHLTMTWGNLTSGSEVCAVYQIPPAVEWMKFVVAAPSGGAIYVDADVVLVTEVA
jgi:hypothetical protein